MPNRPRLFASALACVLSAIQLSAQSPATQSLRGLSVVDATTVWASGTHGTFMWTNNAGGFVQAGVVPGAERLDFRAVHALTIDTAWVMAAGQDTARIYRTNDRGAHWTLQYSDESKGAFLDAIAFFDRDHGLALGDPVDGRFVLLMTSDGGAHWTRHGPDGMPPALPGEGAFAASGTSLITCGPRDAWFATGSASVSRVFHSSDRGATWSAVAAPITAGDAAAGIFSLACRDPKHLIAVGGNYAHPDSSAVTVAITADGGATWSGAPASAATSYLSGVAILSPSSNDVVGVGTNGTSVSRDGGRHWVKLDSAPLNSVAALSSRMWVAVGPRGAFVVRRLP